MSMDDIKLHISHVIEMYYTVSGKKGATIFLPLISPNTAQFSKFLLQQTLQ